MMVPNTTDLLFIEYVPNGHGFTCAVVHGALPLWCKELELLLRATLALPNKPEVVFMMAMLPSNGIMPHGFLGSAEGGTTQLGQYYGIPMISMRNALWRLQAANMTPFDDITTRWHEKYDNSSIGQPLWHFNKIGNKYLADLAIHFIAATAAAPEVTHEAAEPDNVPHSLVPDNTRVPTTLVCAYNKALLYSPQISFSQAADAPWQWEHDIKQKYGFVTRQANATINITWASPEAQYVPTSLFHVWVGYLHSHYDGMLRARYSCSGGCACEEQVVDAHPGPNARPVSIMLYATLQLTQLSGACTVSVMTLPFMRSSTATPLFKINGFIITKCDNGARCTEFPMALMADLSLRR